MPIYEYKCPSCLRKKLYLRKVDDRNKTTKCKQCHEVMKRLVPSRINPHIFPNGGIFFEHASAKGERFHSKQEVREFAKKNDMQFDILE
ncbi:MAG: FmdB family zinc ribbon protein [Candidatus Thorarchaeota archaeon]|jgi:putative FmdB family regulatory protein